MKGIKRIAVVLIAVIAMLGASGCGKLAINTVRGDWVTQTNEDGTLRIAEISEEGKKKSTLVIPKKTGKKRITAIFDSKNFFGAQLESENLEKLIVEPEVGVNASLTCFKLNKFLLLDIEADGYIPSFNGYRGEDYHTYIISGYYFDNKVSDPSLKPANVSFLYNFEGSENRGYCGIDDLDYGSLLTYKPSEPTRAGYKFDGWYKEKECINKWNFEADRAPSIKYNEKEEVIYQETVLYAGWIKIY